MSPISANQHLKGGQETHQKEAKIPTPRILQLVSNQVSLPSHAYYASISRTSTRQNSISGKPTSPEWTHAITILMGHPLSSEQAKHIKKWIIYHRIYKYTMFALKWNPTQFKLDIHMQMYQETNGSLAYLKGHTVRKLVRLMKYMSLLIRQDRPDAQKHNPLYFISGNQLFKLTAHDMKSALVNEKLENHASQKYSSKRVKVVKPKPTNTPSKVPTAIQTSGNSPNDTPITVPTFIQTSVIKKSIKPVDPPQNVATSHLEDPISTTTNLDEVCPLDTSCDHLLHLDSPSLSSELKGNSSVDSVEIEFLPESEGQLDHTYHSPTDIFSEHHDYELFLLQKEFDAPNDNPDHYDIHTCEIQDDILIHATNLSNTFALPKFMAVETRNPLMIQVQYQPLPKLHVIIPSNLNVLITQSISLCNGPSSSIQVPSQG